MLAIPTNQARLPTPFAEVRAAPLTSTPEFLEADYAGPQVLTREPHFIAITPTDGASLIGGGTSRHPTPIVWRTWNTQTAVARAVIAIDPCGCARDPDIPTASFTLTLSQPEVLGGHLILTNVRFSDVRPLGGRRLSRPGIDGYAEFGKVVFSRGIYSWNE